MMKHSLKMTNYKLTKLEAQPWWRAKMTMRVEAITANNCSNKLLNCQTHPSFWCKLMPCTTKHTHRINHQRQMQVDLQACLVMAVSKEPTTLPSSTWFKTLMWLQTIQAFQEGVGSDLRAPKQCPQLPSNKHSCSSNNNSRCNYNW